MEFRQFLQQNTVYLDGGMGTLLQKAGLPLGELPERWNLTHAGEVQAIHTAYFDAGSHVVATNTFGANCLKFSENELEEIIRSAIENVRTAKRESKGGQQKFIALDIGPTGKLLKPYGDFDFEEAVETFAKTVRLGVKYGIDLVLIETMGDSYETKAALLAVKENCDLPVLVSCAYGADGKLMTGASPEAMVALAEGMGADGVGINCSLGPKQMQDTVERLLRVASIPVLVKPNAGLPIAESDGARYDIDEEGFAEEMANFVKQGARLVGGCCGTTPLYIAKTVEKTKGMQPLPLTDKNHTCVSSYTHAVDFDKPILIGERINPTGKKRFRQALAEKDVGYILQEGFTQQEKGAHILDVNVGAPDIDEKIELPRYIQELQAVIDLPLQIDTSDTVAMERSMRLYNGKPLVNSVNGKQESMDAVFPLVKKYGGVAVGLTLDENGIPATAEGRVAIAEKIIAEAEKYGISKKDILIDPLAMAISADADAAAVTLTAVKQIRQRLGVHVSLGVSNVSFGLPAREVVNASFFALALENGLSAAIMNPNSAEMQKTYHAFCALRGWDENFTEYIRFATEVLPTYTENTQTAVQTGVTLGQSSLQNAIVRGLKTEAGIECKALLQTHSAQEIVEREIVPALDRVGQAYEEKRAYLPQLLMSAEAAKSAFEQIKIRLLQTGGSSAKKCKIILATVKGDIHDIGKNIVGTLLENYGFTVIDLGRDISPEEVVNAVLQENAPIVGLSALMTTTLPSMADTVAILKEKAPQVKIMVGGAVLTQEYAEKIGADGYAKDGMGAVRLVESFYAKNV
ncbi:MAG: homocysteine methyltransferase [Clostridiales bacterium]|nr:homocysteine methyltransferase [Clostridiales bacterium]